MYSNVLIHTESTAKATRVSSSERVVITSVPTKATTVTSREKPSIASLATLKLEKTTSSDEATSTPIVLMQAGSKASNLVEANQVIDFLMDNDLLKFENVTALCLMPLQDKCALLTSLTEDTEGLRGISDIVSTYCV